MWRKGKWAYADVVQREDDNSPRSQGLTNLIKVGCKQSALGRDRQGEKLSHENHRRLRPATLHQQCPEIGVSSDNDCSMVNRVLHHLVIARARADDFMDVLCGVSLSGEETTQPRRQVLVDRNLTRMAAAPGGIRFQQVPRNRQAPV